MFRISLAEIRIDGTDTIVLMGTGRPLVLIEDKGNVSWVRSLTQLNRPRTFFKRLALIWRVARWVFEC